MKKIGFIFVTILFSSLLLIGCVTGTKPSTEEMNYSKAIIGYWTEGDSPLAVSAFLEGGFYKGWLYKDRTKAKLLVEMEGKWWIKGNQLFNELSKCNPPIPDFDMGHIFIDQIVQIAENEMILIDEKGQRYSNFRQK